MRKLPSLILLIVFLTACTAPAAQSGIDTPTHTATVPGVSLTDTIPIAPPPETIQAPTLVPNPTTIPETRLPPERWQEWPIVPVVTQRAIEIYRSGQSMGLDGRAFSKVGDCQSVKAAFMGYFDIPERYSLGNDYAYLQETVNNFAGHFNTDGQAVRGGFNAAAVLSPLWADPKACLAGENPLECELRISKPVIVIVSLEVWWEGRTPEQYATLMRRILDTIIAHGAVPILATKADNVEGNNSLNLTTAKLATEYDLPLWNFWAAVQPLPAHGMDTKRNDGFHISTDAWSTRSFTGLEALDSIWRGLLKAVPASSATESLVLTATPGTLATSIQTPYTSAVPKAGTTPISGAGLIVFGVSERQGHSYTYPGVYLLDLSSQRTRQLFGKGVRLQSVSPDGKYLLVSEGSALYRTDLDGTHPLTLTDALFAFGNTDAVWLTDGQIAAVVGQAGKTGISVFSVDGKLVIELPASATHPIELYPGSNISYIYWENGTCNAVGVCQRDQSWVASPDGKLNQALNSLSGPQLAPNGNLLASADASPTALNTVIFAAADGSSPHPSTLPGNLLVDYAWSPDGNELAAIVAMRSDYSGKVSGYRNFELNPKTLDVREYTSSSWMNPRVLWSPDGSELFWIGTTPATGGYKLGGSLVTRASRQVTDLGAAFNLTSPDYLAVTNAAWLALP